MSVVNAVPGSGQDGQSGHVTDGGQGLTSEPVGWNVGLKKSERAIYRGNPNNRPLSEWDSTDGRAGSSYPKGALRLRN